MADCHVTHMDVKWTGPSTEVQFFLVIFFWLYCNKIELNRLAVGTYYSQFNAHFPELLATSPNSQMHIQRLNREARTLEYNMVETGN